MIDLGTFKEICEKYPNLAIKLKPYDCGSWRGSYGESAIFVEDGESELREWLPFIKQLLTHHFTGWKGGTYCYDEISELHIEYDFGNYTDDRLTLKLLIEMSKDNEEIIKTLTDVEKDDD